MFSPMTAVAAPVRAVIELFDDTLAEVRFADLDGARLKALASEVESTAKAVAAQQAALEAARAALAERQEALLAQAQRALAYARVYAESDPELSERLNAIALPRTPKAPRAKVSADARKEPPSSPGTEAPAEPFIAVAEPRAAELSGEEQEAMAAAEKPGARRVGKRVGSSARSPAAAAKDGARTIVRDDVS